jgi:predicted phosphodiesterase
MRRVGGEPAFGHSHIPLDQAGEQIRLFNPGSPASACCTR